MNTKISPNFQVKVFWLSIPYLVNKNENMYFICDFFGKKVTDKNLTEKIIKKMNFMLKTKRDYFGI